MTEPGESGPNRNAKRLVEISKEVEDLAQNAQSERVRINGLIEEIQELAREAELNLRLPGKMELLEQGKEPGDIQLALSVIPAHRLKEIEKEFFRSVPAFHPFDRFDLFVLLALGGLSLVAELLLVGLPPKNRWVPKNEGGLVPVGWISEQIRSWQVNSDNWLARLCKVPFDKVYIPNTDTGFTPSNHRLLSFGHDPSPLGMVMGLIDIASGGMSGITREGQLFHVPGIPPGPAKILSAPLLWIGHLASDIATPMGLPPPGWALTQLLRIPAPGAPGEATIADVARLMYEQGYDFRHYLSGGIVPALVEIVIRTYHFVRYEYPTRFDRVPKGVSANIAEREIQEMQLRGHKEAMLFWAHATAAAINAGKIVLQGATGDYFSAARAINLAQWQAFAVRSVSYAAFRLRDKKPEQIILNRKLLNKRWDELSTMPGVVGYSQEEGAPSLNVS